ncbi:MAG: amidase, partial [Sandaracinaceae bacterium]
MTLAEYDSCDGVALAELIQKREVTPAELLEEAIARAERVNPRINAIVVRMFDIARERAATPLSGPFAGVPFLIKDLASGYAGVLHQAGSRLYRGYIPEQHNTLIARYLDAGLVIFGKTNTPELGVLPVTEPELYGPTHNPWRYGVTPGGSSGGAAASVAAGIVPMAHGGDGGGSLRIPASCCGLFGLKPSRGRMPTGPKEPERFFGFSAEHAITRSVRDSAAHLDISSGPEPIT